MFFSFQNNLFHQMLIRIQKNKRKKKHWKSILSNYQCCTFTRYNIQPNLSTKKNNKTTIKHVEYKNPSSILRMWPRINYKTRRNKKKSKVWENEFNFSGLNSSVRINKNHSGEKQNHHESGETKILEKSVAHIHRHKWMVLVPHLIQCYLV